MIGKVVLRRFFPCNLTRMLLCPFALVCGAVTESLRTIKWGITVVICLWFFFIAFFWRRIVDACMILVFETILTIDNLLKIHLGSSHFMVMVLKETWHFLFTLKSFCSNIYPQRHISQVRVGLHYWLDYDKMKHVILIIRFKHCDGEPKTWYSTFSSCKCSGEIWMLCVCNLF